MIFRFHQCMRALLVGTQTAGNRCGVLRRRGCWQDRAEEVFVLPRPIPDPRSKAGALCRQYLLLKYGEQTALADAFIREIDQSAPGSEDSRWQAFISADDEVDEILKPLDRAFQEWSQI